jgi:hypothetical protein
LAARHPKSFLGLESSDDDFEIICRWQLTLFDDLFIYDVVLVSLELFNSLLTSFFVMVFRGTM